MVTKLITGIRSKQIAIQSLGLPKQVFVRVEPKNPLHVLIDALGEEYCDHSIAEYETEDMQIDGANDEPDQAWKEEVLICPCGAVYNDVFDMWEYV